MTVTSVSSVSHCNVFFTGSSSLPLLVLSGLQMLVHVLTPNLQSAFLELALRCKAIVCCRYGTVTAELAYIWPISSTCIFPRAPCPHALIARLLSLPLLGSLCSAMWHKLRVMQVLGLIGHSIVQVWDEGRCRSLLLSCLAGLGQFVCSHPCMPEVIEQ